MKSVSKKIALIGSLSLAAMQTASAGDWSLTVFGGKAKADGFGEVCSSATLSSNISLILAGVNSRISCTADDSDSALGVNVAYNFNEAWGLEVGYADLGEYTLELSGFGDPADITIDAKAPYIAGVATLGLTDKLSLSSRLGVFRASGNVSSFLIGTSERISGDVQAYGGLSLDYETTKSITTQLRYDNFDEFDIVGLGIKFRF